MTDAILKGKNGALIFLPGDAHRGDQGLAMPAILLMQIDGPELDAVSVAFDVAPKAGEQLVLKCAGKRHFFRVVDLMHVQALEGTMKCIATISWDGAVSAASLERKAHLQLVVDNVDKLKQ